MEISNPVFIKLSPSCNKICLLDRSKELPLDPGCIFGSDYYGFVISKEENKKISMEPYCTDFRIESVGLHEEYLMIFEQFKKRPWIFSKKGELLQEATEVPDEVKNSNILLKR